MKSLKIAIVIILGFVIFLVIGGVNDYFAASRVKMQISAEPSSVPADGQTKALLKVLVMNRDGSPRRGDRIYCLTSYGNLVASRVLTNQQGIATFAYYPVRSTDIAAAKNDTLTFYDESVAKIIQIEPRAEYMLTITQPLKSNKKGMTSDDFFN